MKSNKKLGFTLAEIMIVLVVIGILSAILLPVAFNSTPDENVMKFKKGNATLGKVIRELVNLDKYYKDGNLGVMVTGDFVTKPNYFCRTFIELVNFKNQDCNKNMSSSVSGEYELSKDCDTKRGYLDDMCRLNQYNEIETNDGIIYYEANKNYLFSNSWMQDQFKHGLGNIYKVVCFDIDGLNKGEDPFGYGIRADGKLINGRRATNWIKKTVQNNEDTEEEILEPPYGTKCSSSDRACSKGSYLDTSKNSCVDCFIKFPNCSECTQSGCTKCKGATKLASNKKSCEYSRCSENEYLDTVNNVCMSCSSLFPNCKTCNSSMCIECNEGSTLSIDKTTCNAETPFDCVGSDFMQIGDLCWTRRNMGDSPNLRLSDSVTSVTSGTFCDSPNQKCCWSGKTSDPCNTTNGSYSGCERTVCNWIAAVDVCKNLSAGGKTWRLPTASELGSLSIDDYSVGKGDNGLMLCDWESSSGSSLCTSAAYCKGARGGWCYAPNIWSSDNNGNMATKYCIYTGSTIGKWSSNVHEKDYAFGVRCVTNNPIN